MRTPDSGFRSLLSPSNPFRFTHFRYYLIILLDIEYSHVIIHRELLVPTRQPPLSTPPLFFPSPYLFSFHNLTKATTYCTLESRTKMNQVNANSNSINALPVVAPSTDSAMLQPSPLGLPRQPHRAAASIVSPTLLAAACLSQIRNLSFASTMPSSRSTKTLLSTSPPPSPPD